MTVVRSTGMTTTIRTADSTAAPESAEHVDVDELIEADSLVEEVSIDGMCGVY
jgi:mycofactocin precursor